MMDLEKLLTKEDDAVLLDIELELAAGTVPITGSAHAYCHKLNQMIDRGTLCINPTTYRKIYLPTLARAVHKELARRWMNIILKEKDK